ncbi:hypothetical protein [Streptomyces sp. ST2-7A]|uniref:hypothetical protein n=1 Tax=Streptomyces sp. ST2-7A TaxID=2907214 RepID=UPI001F1C4B6B|nr:hypothetical protein [Streptomyces sp. ST2-7A]MCE7081917.1 hypothetical protein [Streptomyces sp. ST2-7A]
MIPPRARPCPPAERSGRAGEPDEPRDDHADRSAPVPDRGEPGGRAGRHDVVAAVAAFALFAAAAVIGTAIDDDGRLSLRWPPLYADWEPHLGPGTAPTLLVAVLVVGWGPALARRLPWRGLLWAGWPASLAWTFSLAMIDGWERGVVGRLTGRHEYLAAVDRVDDLGRFLTTFAHHVPLDAPDNWPVHVAGHPPGALLTFVGLDRIGAGGGVWGAAFILLVAASAVPAVLVTVRVLAGTTTARRVAPFAVLLPAAVWMGVSADAYFAAVAAWGVALLALAASGAARRPGLTAFGAGLLFGWMLFLSYGLVLMAPTALAVLLLTRSWRPVLPVVAGMAVVALTFLAGGFWWWEGYQALVERYHQGAARLRPYGYFVWANAAVLAVTVGPAGIAGLRRAATAGARWTRGVVRHGRADAEPATRRRRGPAAAVGSLAASVRASFPVVPAVLPAGGGGGSDARSSPPARHGTGPVGGAGPLVVLALSAAVAVLAATLSGMSKAETERIWLPFVLWLIPAAALLPGRWVRWWLPAQAATAVAVNHLLLTGW